VLRKSAAPRFAAWDYIQVAMLAEKSCGECSLCCKTMQIPELDKPKDHWCSHCNPGAGCAIYETRPEVCRAFKCRWLIDPAMGPEWKPSRSGLVLVMDSDARLGVHVDPDRPGAWRREPYLGALRRLAGMRLQRGAFIFILEKGVTTVLLPQQEIEVGLVGPDDRILLRERPSPAGPLFEAELVRAEKAEALAATGGWSLVP
jgi:hypothetical protein